MPSFTVHLDTPIRRTFRVEQVAGMLDVPLEERLAHTLTAEVPGMDETWTIGAIVGPSGSGKTTLARAAFGEALYEPQPWPEDRAIIDCLDDTPTTTWSARSASGKSTLEANGITARRPTLRVGARDPRSGCPGPLSIKDLTRVVIGVGLGSVPTWLKPYRVLSTGERFRADLARALLQGGRNLTPRRKGAEKAANSSICASAPLREDFCLVACDEFTSTLDRSVAKTTSAALARLLRRNNALLRFVALTCHTDILPWLAPDWVLELGRAGQSLADASGWCGSGEARLTRVRLRGPGIHLQVRRVPQAMWRLFAPHHYLAGGLAASATCYAAWWDEEAGIQTRSVSEGPIVAPCGKPSPSLTLRVDVRPIAFCAVVAALGWRRTKRITRLVTLPEFQGLGIGTQLAETVAAHEAQRGNRVTITASHPAIVGHCSHSPRWRLLGVKKSGSTRQRMGGRAIRCSTGRAVASFEFVGEE